MKTRAKNVWKQVDIALILSASNQASSKVILVEFFLNTDFEGQKRNSNF